MYLDWRIRKQTNFIARRQEKYFQKAVLLHRRFEGGLCLSCKGGGGVVTLNKMRTRSGENHNEFI